jgi:hypothetical protein
MRTKTQNTERVYDVRFQDQRCERVTASHVVMAIRAAQFARLQKLAARIRRCTVLDELIVQSVRVAK